jgi:hypothetical protein
MKINEQVETRVRAVLDAAVRRDRDKLNLALRAFPNDDAARQGVELAIAVAAYVMLDVHHGRPSDEQVATVAQEIADAEGWAGFTADEIGRFLSYTLAGKSLAGVLPDDAVILLSFIVPATLLSAFRPKEEIWEAYLDRAEASIESN